MTAAAGPAVGGGTAARVALGVFAAASAAHLAGHLGGAGWLAQGTKPLLMPALAAYAAACGAPRALLAGLAFGWGGDVLLQVGGEGPFLAGMASFAAGHVCYLTLFRRHAGRGRTGTGPPATPAAAAGAGTPLPERAARPGRPRTRAERRLAVAYSGVWAAGVASLWPGLDPGMRGPVAAYSLLLAAMALGAARLGPRAATGGALFLLSDTLIATRLADWPQFPAAGFWVMATYLAAQYLIADGVLRHRVPGHDDGRAATREAPPPGPAGESLRPAP